MSEKIRLGILGATGMAGREAVKHQEKLERKGQNYANLTIVTGSPRSSGRELGEIFKEKEERLSEAYDFWKPSECPEKYRDMVVSETEVEKIAEKADYVISALPSSVAEELEPELRKRGVHVFSNSSSYRWSENIPLLIPEINHHHINRVKDQQTEGKQANNPNCTTAGYVPLIGIFEDLGYNLEEINLTTMQSISGKGDRVSKTEYRNWIEGNVIDDWNPEENFNGEERKSEIEPQKILGRTREKQETVNQFKKLRENEKSENNLDIIPINADTNRVATQYGHLESLVIDMENKVDTQKLKEEIENWEVPEELKHLPSTPEKIIKLKTGLEPAEHVFAGDGMTVVVGDIRQLGPRKISLKTLSHNLRRGATWTARQSLELFLYQIQGFQFTD